MKLGAASIALAFAVIVPAALEATPITITFTGTPTLKKGVFGSETAVIVFGSFTYDSDAVDSKKGPKEDKFVSNLFGNDANVVWGFEVTLGRTTRSLFSGKSTKFRLKLKDGSKKSGKGKKSGKSKKNDAYSFRSGAGGIKLQYRNGDAIQNLQGIAPSTIPNLSLFDGLATGFYKLGADRLEFDLLTISTPKITGFASSSHSASAVPEPGTIILLGLGVTTFAFARHSRRKSVKKKAEGRSSL